MNLIQISDLSANDITNIWDMVGQADMQIQGRVAWSFEGNGIRTRTSFIQAFQELGLSFIELPNLLKTAERTTDLAAYLDDFYDVYVIRERNHERLAQFASDSRRPVINALSSLGHPCEVLTDAYYVNQQIAPIRQARICLWGPPSNVMLSWHELASVMEFQITQICEAAFHEEKPHVSYTSSISSSFDIVITDGWPGTYDNAEWSLTTAHLEQMGSPKFLPTPPFSIGKEIALDPVSYAGFTGYQQKNLLLPVQKAILLYLLNKTQS
ncbi:ornithine carbamoyltransferase [Undibacterium sp. Ji83W]|uniref:ornithine carbamoyltransferase n=1 Tax=Undibacterium sp. Ji83W TaxID=3413043 RepID=UPI003BF30B11